MTKGGNKAPAEKTASWWYAKTRFDKETETYSLVRDSVEIDLVDFLQWLYDEGFRYTKIYENGILFKVENNRILREVEVAELRQHVVRHIQQLPPELPISDLRGEITGTIPQKILLTKILKGVGFYFDTKKIEAYLAPRDTFTMCADTASVKYVYFRNGFLTVTRRGIDFAPYTELPGYIWHSEIIQQDYVPELGPDPEGQGVVKRFFQLVAADTSLDEKTRTQRMVDLCTIAGYLCHSYTDYKLQAVLLTDSRIGESNEPNGRSGKTLFMRLCSGLLCPEPTRPDKTSVEISGKNFDPTDPFRYGNSGVSHETKLITLNDVKRGFKTECLFNDITDGLQVNKKNQQPFKILAKMAVISNMSIEMAGDSNKDRFCIFEFSGYFNVGHDPGTEFMQPGTGRKYWFFKDFDAREWCRYYYFMAQCVQCFFQNDSQLPKPESINYEARTLKEHVPAEVVEWIEAELCPLPGEWYETKTMHQRFTTSYPDFEKLKQAKFTEYLKKYMRYSPQWAEYTQLANFRRDSTGRREICFLRDNNEPPF